MNFAKRCGNVFLYRVSDICLSEPPRIHIKKTEYIKNFINLSSNKYYFIKYNFFLKKIYIVLHNDSPLFICLQIDLYFRFVCTVHNTGYPNFTQRNHNPNTQNGGTPCITRDLFQLYLAVINVQIFRVISYYRIIIFYF